MDTQEHRFTMDDKENPLGVGGLTIGSLAEVTKEKTKRYDQSEKWSKPSLYLASEYRMG